MPSRRHVILAGLFSCVLFLSLARADISVPVAVKAEFATTFASPSLEVKFNGGTFTVTSASVPGTASKAFALDVPQYFRFKATNVVEYWITLTAPPAYEFLINGVVRRSVRLNGYSVAGQPAAGVVDGAIAQVTLIKSGSRGSGATAPIGEAGSISWGNPKTESDPSQWPSISFNLGTGTDGKALMPLRIPLIKRDSRSRELFADDVVPPSGPGVDFVSPPDANGGFVLDAPESRVRYTVDGTAGTFVVSFSPPGSSTPFVSYAFEFPEWYWPSGTGIPAGVDPKNYVKVTKTVTGGNVYETYFRGSYYFDSIRLKPVAGAQLKTSNTWTLEDWHKYNEAPIRTIFGERVRQGVQPIVSAFYVSAEITDTIQVRSGWASNPGDEVARTTQVFSEYSSYEAVEAPVIPLTVVHSKTVEGTGTRTYTTEYFRHPGQPTISGSKSPQGRVQYHDLVGGPGTVTYETWLDVSPSHTLGTSTIVSAGALATTTIHNSDSRWADFKWPASVERAVKASPSPVVVAKSSFTYDEATVGSEKIVVVTQSDYKTASAVGAVGKVKRYRPDAVDEALSDRPYSIQAADGTKQSFAYEHVGAGNDFRVTSLKGTATDAGLGGDTVSLLGAPGAPGSLAIDAINLHENRSLKVIESYSRARLMGRETHVYTGMVAGAPAFSLVHSESFTYTDDGRALTKSASNGSTYNAQWTGSRKDWDKDESGLKTEYTYDAADRVVTATTEAVAAFSVEAIKTEYVYDAAHRLRYTKVGADSPLITETIYDLGGRPEKRVYPGGITTDYEPTDGGRKIREVYAKGTADEADKTIELFKDGRLSSVIGSAQVSEYHTYSLEGGVQFRTTRLANSQTGRFKKVAYDLMGRVTSEETKGFPVAGQRKAIVITSAYNAKGQLESIKSEYDPTGSKIPIAGDILYEYDEFGAPSAFGLDLPLGTTAVDSTLTNASNDRLSRSETKLDYAGSAWWSKATSHVYHTNGSSARHSLNVYQRLSAFPAGVLSQTDTVDLYNNRTTATVSLGETPLSLDERIGLADGTTTVRTKVRGLTVRERHFADDAVINVNTPRLEVTYKYDNKGRLISKTDSRGVVSKQDYWSGTSRVWKTYGRNAANTTDVTLSTSTYDNLGRLASTSDADADTVSFGYDAAGRIKDRTTGSGAYRLHYEYTDYGELKELWTYRDSTKVDKTTRSYDAETGLLKSEQYADPNQDPVEYEYTYTSSHKEVKRTLSRGVTV